MRPSLENDKKLIISFSGILIIFFIIFFYLFLSGSLIGIFLEIIFILLIKILFFSIFTKIILHSTTFEELIELFVNLIHCFLFGRKNLIKISCGLIEGDYLLLKKIPPKQLLFIEQRSGAFIKNRKSQIEILLPGFHILNKESMVINSFYRGLKRLNFGPQNQSMISPKRENETIADYHLRKNLIEKTRAESKDEKIINAAFEAFYIIENQKQENQKLIDLHRWISPSLSSPFMEVLEEKIIDQISEDWKARAKSLSFAEIMSKFPDRFQLHDDILKGIKIEVFIKKIFPYEIK